MMILEFRTLQAANNAQNTIYTVLKNRMASEGYTVDADGFVVGKNSKTKATRTDATRTEKWDNVKQSPDNTYYFRAPQAEYLRALLPFVESREMEMPESWYEKE